MRFRALRTFGALVAMIVVQSCATVPVQPKSADVVVVADQKSIDAVTFSADGSTLYYATGTERCTIFAVTVASIETRSVHELSFCPTRLTSFSDGSLLAAKDDMSTWISADGSLLFEGRVIPAAIDMSHFVERVSDGFVWINGETTVALDPVVLRSPRIATGGTPLGVEVGSEGERLVRFDGPKPTPITPSFASIDSFDIAPRGEEIVFSARVDSGYDIGLVSVSGGEINWVAPDPADERNVTWAPRGSKITYSFESVDATLVRSVHVPTSFQVMFELPLTTVRQIAWEPEAERIALVVESPGQGPGIDTIRYNGEARATIVEPEERVDTPIESVLWEGGSGVLLGPDLVRYDQEIPTVLWVEAGGPFAWNAAVARLRARGIPVMLTTAPRVGEPSTIFGELPWVRASTLYIVDISGEANVLTSGLGFAAAFVRQGGDPAEAENVELISGGDEAARVDVVHRILERTGATP